MIKWFMGLNRHLRIAIISAPFLGILGFGLTDLWVNKDQPERPQQHVAVHQLALIGECVLDAAGCRLNNAEMNVALRAAPASTERLVRLDIGASGHVRGLKVALVQNGWEEKLLAQRTMKTDQWYVEFPRTVLTQMTFTIRIALAQTKRVYLAEFAARLE